MLGIEIFQMDQRKYPYFEEIDQANKKEIVDACKSFFGGDFDKLATVEDTLISYNGYGCRDLKYNMKDGSQLLDFTFTFLKYSKRNHSVALGSGHGDEKPDSTISAQLLLTVELKNGRELSKTLIITNIQRSLENLFNRGVPAEYITRYDTQKRAPSVYAKKGDKINEANIIYNDTVRFITQKMEAVILSNYQQVLGEIKENGEIAKNYNGISDEQRKQWFLTSTIQAAEKVFRNVDASTLKSSYNNTSSNANSLHVLLRLPQNMKL